MALNAATLGTLIDNAMQSQQPLADVDARAGRKKMADAIAEAVVAHITSAAVLVVPAAGLVSATPGSPVTGVAAGTIT